MKAKPKLTAKEIAAITADYQAGLPDWQITNGDTLVRVNGAIGQAIWFDRLRTGSYRPTCRIHVFAAPDDAGGTVVLPQLLGIKNKEISREGHAKMLPSVLSALKTEILPSITKPLDLVGVAELLCSRAKGRPAGAYALACLWAALGRGGEATRWIREYYSAVEALGMPEQPVDQTRAAFLEKVTRWIGETDCTAKMSDIVEHEKGKLLAA